MRHGERNLPALGIAPGATETAEELEALLEGTYGAGNVEVTRRPGRQRAR